MNTLAIRSGIALALAFGLAGPAFATDTTPSRLAAQLESDGPQAKALHVFIAKKKFTPSMFNPVQRSESDRLRLQVIIDALGTRLLPLADLPQDKARVFAEFRRSMAEIDVVESEDKEQAASYLEELMAIFSIASSDGLLNNWVYGFDPKDIKGAHGTH